VPSLSSRRAPSTYSPLYHLAPARPSSPFLPFYVVVVVLPSVRLSSSFPSLTPRFHPRAAPSFSPKPVSLPSPSSPLDSQLPLPAVATHLAPLASSLALLVLSLSLSLVACRPFPPFLPRLYQRALLVVHTPRAPTFESEESEESERELEKSKSERSVRRRRRRRALALALVSEMNSESESGRAMQHTATSSASRARFLVLVRVARTALLAVGSQETRARREGENLLARMQRTHNGRDR